MGESYASDFFVVDRGRGRSKVVVSSIRRWDK